MNLLEKIEAGARVNRNEGQPVTIDHVDATLEELKELRRLTRKKLIRVVQTSHGGDRVWMYRPLSFKTYEETQRG